MPILLFTRNNIASANIARALIERHGFDKCMEGKCCDWETWKHGEVQLVDTNAPTVLDVPTDFDGEPGGDCLIILSSHKSKTPGKMLTAHVPGNWLSEAKMGGEPKTLNIAPAAVLKQLICALKKEGDRIGWPVSLEADHHGPTCTVPIVFVEIGNGESEWNDQEAADAVASAVANAITDTVVSAGQGCPVPKELETILGVGGGHYSRGFTKLVLDATKNMAVGHIAPKYVIDEMDEGLFKQAIEKCTEQVTTVVILKDEVNAKQREKVMMLAEKFGLKCQVF